MLYSSKIEAQRQNCFPVFNHRIVRIIKVRKGLKDHQVQTGDGAAFMALFSDEQNMHLGAFCHLLLMAFVEIESKIPSLGAIFSGPFSKLLETEIKRFLK